MRRDRFSLHAPFRRGLTKLTRIRLARHTLVKMSLRGALCGIALAGCSTAPIPPTYSQAELKARCEGWGGRWHNGDPMRSFCEDNTVH